MLSKPAHLWGITTAKLNCQDLRKMHIFKENVWGYFIFFPFLPPSKYTQEVEKSFAAG